MMNAIILTLGLLAALLVLVTGLEYVPTFRRGRAAQAIAASCEPAGDAITGLRRALIPLEKPVHRLASPGLLTKTAAALYWGRMGGGWADWTPLQFLTLRAAAALAAFGGGLLIFGQPLLAAAAGFLGWLGSAAPLNNRARRTRRQFQAQLPEFVNLVAAQMAAGVSLEEALRRSARGQSLPAAWLRQVIQQAQGRTLLGQILQEAGASQLGELISLGVQLGFIQRGTAQQLLLAQLSTQMAADYIGQTELRAEKIGAELVIPMVIFYFLPFMTSLLLVIAWPILTGLL